MILALNSIIYVFSVKSTERVGQNWFTLSSSSQFYRNFDSDTQDTPKKLHFLVFQVILCRFRDIRRLMCERNASGTGKSQLPRCPGAIAEHGAAANCVIFRRYGSTTLFILFFLGFLQLLHPTESEVQGNWHQGGRSHPVSVIAGYQETYQPLSSAETHFHSVWVIESIKMPFFTSV